MTNYARAFKNNHNNISDTVQKDQSGYAVICAKSNDFFDAHGGIY